jgi:hypothetical protein
MEAENFLVSRSSRKLVGLIAFFAAVVAFWVGCMVAAHRVGERRQITVARLSAVSADTEAILWTANQIDLGTPAAPDAEGFRRLGDLQYRVGANLAIQQQLGTEAARLTVVHDWLDRAVNLTPVVLLAIAVIAVAVGIRSSRRGRNGLCAICGYDLRESPTRCPECGSRRIGGD